MNNKNTIIVRNLLSMIVTIVGDIGTIGTIKYNRQNAQVKIHDRKLWIVNGENGIFESGDMLLNINNLDYYSIINLFTLIRKRVDELKDQGLLPSHIER